MRREGEEGRPAGGLAVGSPGWKLHRARRDRGLTQNGTDEAAGFPGTRRANSYEAGRATPPGEYLEPLAALWGIPMAWFLDGRESAVPPAPGSLPSAVAATRTVPVYAPLPGPESRGERREERPARAGFPLPPGAHYRRYLGEDRDGLKRGDLLLVVPETGPRAGTLAVVASGGEADVATLGRREDAAGGTFLGTVVEAVRLLPTGLTVAFEFEGGLSPDQLAAPFG